MEAEMKSEMKDNDWLAETFRFVDDKTVKIPTDDIRLILEQKSVLKKGERIPSRIRRSLEKAGFIRSSNTQYWCCIELINDEL